jgi:hypothetical protein
MWHNRDTKEVSRKTAKGMEVFHEPAVVIDYTLRMGGVDGGNHYCSSYRFLKKRWRRLCFRIL